MIRETTTLYKERDGKVSEAALESFKNYFGNGRIFPKADEAHVVDTRLAFMKSGMAMDDWKSFLETYNLPDVVMAEVSTHQPDQSQQTTQVDPKNDGPKNQGNE